MLLETPKRQQQSYLFVFVLFVALKRRILLEICIMFCFGTKKCSVELSVFFLVFLLTCYSSPLAVPGLVLHVAASGFVLRVAGFSTVRLNSAASLTLRNSIW